MGIATSLTVREGPLVSHVNAALTPRARLPVARLVVEQHVPIFEVAARFQCSWPTVKRWADRDRAGEPMPDGSSRPYSSPNKDQQAGHLPGCVAATVVAPRLCPARRQGRVAPWRVYRVLAAGGLNRLSGVDRATGEPVRHLRARPPRIVGSCRCEEVGQHSRRRRLAVPGQAAGRPELGRLRPAQERALRADPRLRLRPLRSSTTTPGWSTPRSTTTKPR